MGGLLRGRGGVCLWGTRAPLVAGRWLVDGCLPPPPHSLPALHSSPSPLQVPMDHLPGLHWVSEWVGWVGEWVGWMGESGTARPCAATRDATFPFPLASRHSALPACPPAGTPPHQVPPQAPPQQPRVSSAQNQRHTPSILPPCSRRRTRTAMAAPSCRPSPPA